MTLLGLVSGSLAQKVDTIGTVFLEFTIAKNGELKEIQVLKGIDPYFNQRAVSVLRKSPNWEPATNAKGTQIDQKGIFPVQMIQTSQGGYNFYKEYIFWNSIRSMDTVTRRRFIHAEKTNLDIRIISIVSGKEDAYQIEAYAALAMKTTRIGEGAKNEKALFNLLLNAAEAETRKLRKKAGRIRKKNLYRQLKKLEQATQKANANFQDLMLKVLLETEEGSNREKLRLWSTRVIKSLN